MKTTLALLLISLSTLSFAGEYDGVHQRFFSVLTRLYQQKVDANFCQNAGEDCTLRITNLNCIRDVKCEVIFTDEKGLSHYAPAPKSENVYLSLYIITRKAAAVFSPAIERYGRRYRPNFRLTQPMECVGKSDFSAAECL